MWENHFFPCRIAEYVACKCQDELLGWKLALEKVNGQQVALQDIADAILLASVKANTLESDIGLEEGAASR